MIPITKNITVVDEQENKYEATYLKRAKGLVKNGRARFIDENTICLTCPPIENELEDNKMSENKNSCLDEISEALENTLNSETENSKDTPKLTLEYLLQKIEEISKDQPYISEAITALEFMQSGGPGDVGAQAKAHALGEIVKAREATNQKLLSLYEKMYDDSKSEQDMQSKRITTLQDLFCTNAFEAICTNNDGEELNYIIDTIRQILAGR